MERYKIFKQVTLALLLTLFCGNMAYAQLQIKGVELNSNFSSATGGTNYNVFGLDLNARMRLHHNALPENLDFYVGLHQKFHYWVDEIGPDISTPGLFTNLHPAKSFFDEGSIRRLMISFGPAYTLHFGKNFGWTNDLQFMFSPYPKSKLHYDEVELKANTVTHKSVSLSNGMTLGVGINSNFWWKLPFKSKHDFRLGLNLGYEYVDMHKPLRNFEYKGEKPFSVMTKRLNHVGHVGLNLGIAFN